MKEESTGSCPQGNGIPPGGLQEAVQVLRTCFSTVRVKTWLAEDGTAIGVRLQGSEDDLGVRRLVAYNLAQCLPPALSVIGIKPETEAEIQH